MEILINQFLNKNNIFAVIGVSRDTAKYGNQVFNYLLESGYTVYPINPREENISGIKCYPSLAELPIKPDLVDIVVPPKIALEIIKQCVKLGLNNIWFQPGSESDEAIKLCQANNLNFVSGVCVMAEHKAQIAK
ncbi:MAG: CoA-binding protein [Patescibacteria group bacterium]